MFQKYASVYIFRCSKGHQQMRPIVPNVACPGPFTCDMQTGKRNPDPNAHGLMRCKEIAVYECIRRVKVQKRA